MSLNLITGYSGTSHITSASDGCTNAGLYGKGKYVLNIAEKFGAEIISNNLIRIKSGYAINQGRKIELAINDYEEVEIDNGLQGVKRCDLIVIHYEKNLTTGIETGSVKVIKGTSGDIYSDPAYTSGDIINGANEDDFLLYRVKINGLSIEAVEPLFTVTESLMTLLDNMQENSKKLMGEADISKIGDGTVKGAIWTLADSDKKINQSLSEKNGISFKSESASTSYSVAANSTATQRINRPSTPEGYKLMLLRVSNFSADKDLSICYPIYNGGDRFWVRNHSVANQTGKITIQGIYYKIN